MLTILTISHLSSFVAVSNRNFDKVCEDKGCVSVEPFFPQS